MKDSIILLFPDVVAVLGRSVRVIGANAVQMLNCLRCRRNFKFLRDRQNCIPAAGKIFDNCFFAGTEFGHFPILANLFYSGMHLAGLISSASIPMGNQHKRRINFLMTTLKSYLHGLAAQSNQKGIAR